MFYIRYNLFNHEKVKKLISENFANSKRTKCFIYFKDKNGNFFNIEKVKPLFEWYKSWCAWVSRGSKEPVNFDNIILIDTEEKLNLIPNGDNNNNNIGVENG